MSVAVAAGPAHESPVAELESLSDRAPPEIRKMFSKLLWMLKAPEVFLEGARKGGTGPGPALRPGVEGLREKRTFPAALGL
jgi:hypothetical protein